MSRAEEVLRAQAQDELLDDFGVEHAGCEDRLLRVDVLRQLRALGGIESLRSRVSVVFCLASHLPSLDSTVPPW